MKNDTYDKLKNAVKSLSQMNQEFNDQEFFQFSLSNEEIDALEKLIEYYSTRNKEDKSKALAEDASKKILENEENEQDIKESQKRAKEQFAKELEKFDEDQLAIYHASCKVIRAKNDLDAITKKLYTATTEVFNLTHETENARIDVDRARESYESARKKEIELEKHTLELKEKLEKLELSLTPIESQNKLDLDSVNHQYEKASSEIHFIEKQLENDPGNRDLKEQYHQKLNELTQLQSKKEQLQSQRDDITEKRAEVDSFKKTLKEQQSELGQAKKQTKTCKATLDKAEKNLEKQESSLKKALEKEKEHFKNYKTSEQAYEEAKANLEEKKRIAAKRKEQRNSPSANTSRPSQNDSREPGAGASPIHPSASTPLSQMRTAQSPNLARPKGPREDQEDDLRKKFQNTVPGA